MELGHRTRPVLVVLHATRKVGTVGTTVCRRCGIGSLAFALQRPLARDLDAIGKEVHGTFGGNVQVTIFRSRAVQTTKRKRFAWDCW